MLLLFRSTTRQVHVRGLDVSCVPLAGWRVIADPAALDRARWPKGALVVRISADDAFIVSANEPKPAGDQFAIVTPEHGFDGIELSAPEVRAVADRHIEWQLPSDRPAIAQGQIAGVPAKLVLRADGSALLLVACAARAELVERLVG